MIAIQRFVEPQPLIVEFRCGGDDGGATVEQLCHHRRRDGTLGCAGDDGDVIGVATGGGILRAGSNARIKRGVDESTLGQRAAAPPVGLGGHCVAGSLEGLRQRRPIRVDVILVGQPQLDQILPGACPAIVKQDSFLGVECRCDKSRPVRAEFGGDQVDQLGVGG